MHALMLGKKKKKKKQEGWSFIDIFISGNIQSQVILEDKVYNDELHDKYQRSFIWNPCWQRSLTFSPFLFT